MSQGFSIMIIGESYDLRHIKDKLYSIHIIGFYQPLAVRNSETKLSRRSAAVQIITMLHVLERYQASVADVIEKCDNARTT